MNVPMDGSVEIGLDDLPVLHVVDYDVFDRFGRMYRHVALALSAEGVRVTLVTDDPVALADLEGTPVECHWARHLTGWLAWQTRRELARRLLPGPRLVHLWGTAWLESINEWTRQHTLPLLVHALSVNDVTQLGRRNWGPHVHVAAGCAGFVPLFAEYSAALGRLAQVCPPALLMPNQQTPSAVDQPTLGVAWTGRFADEAGLLTLIDALTQLRQKGFDLQAALIGAGTPTRTVRERIQTKGIRGCVSLIDEPDYWDKALAGVDALIVPTRQDELTLAPVLAMACGTTVIAARDQVADWFVDERTCWLFSPGSAVELAYYLQRVAERDRKVARLRETAAAYVREQHGINRLVDGLLAAYRGALSARTAAP